MSLPDRRAFLSLALAAPLAACGFRPVYGPGGVGAALRRQVLVAPPVTPDEFILVRELETRLGRPSSPGFSLQTRLLVEPEGLGITAGGDITRYNLVGRVLYTLRRLPDGEELTSGEVQNFTGYSATGSTAETLAAARDARTRLMAILADQIVTRLYAAPELTGA